MQIFDKTRLENTVLKRGARALFAGGLISKEQKEFIEDQLPSYKEQNILVRIGLFILGCLLYSSCCGLFAFITMVGGNEHYGSTFFVYAAFGFFTLEFVIRNLNYYANGLDDAFLFCAQVCILLAVGFITEDFRVLAPLFFTAALVGAFCSLRYVDQFSAFLSCLGITIFVAHLVIQAGSAGASFLPFVAMALAAGIYIFQRWLRKKAGPETIYKNCLQVIFVFSLFLFYLGGNYFVVREAGQELMGTVVAEGQDIPLAFVFYAFTFLVPLSYLYFSLVKKNRSLLWTALITFTLSVLTVRYYYELMPVEIVLVTGGALLFALSFYAMHKLKKRESGLTYEPDRYKNAEALSAVEVLALLQRHAVKPGAEQASDVEFGGGEFGGGGSGGEY